MSKYLKTVSIFVLSFQNVPPKFGLLRASEAVCQVQPPKSEPHGTLVCVTACVSVGVGSNSKSAVTLTYNLVHVNLQFYI